MTSVRFIIKGEIVETERSGHVTSFTINTNETIIQRSNNRYDELLERMRLNNEELASCTTHHDIRAAQIRHKESQMGLKGPCVLHALKHFDVGQSFVVDSLHNIYLGVFVSFIENLCLTSFCLETFVEAVVELIIQIRTMEYIHEIVKFG